MLIINGYRNRRPGIVPPRAASLQTDLIRIFTECRETRMSRLPWAMSRLPGSLCANSFAISRRFDDFVRELVLQRTDTWRIFQIVHKIACRLMVRCGSRKGVCSCQPG